MRVVCSLCKHESRGLCTKKGQKNKPIRVAVNKKRSCGLYEEDALRVLDEYRKNEAHKKKLERMSMQAKLRRRALEELNNKALEQAAAELETTKK